MVFAPSLVKESQNRMFSILIRGIWVHGITDKTASARVTNLCCVQPELTVLHMEDCSSRYLRAGRHIHKTARIAPNLKRHRYSYYLRLYSGMSGSPEKHMGRTVPTYVEHVREIEAKWAKFRRPLWREDQLHFDRLLRSVRYYSPSATYQCSDDPREWLRPQMGQPGVRYA